MECSYCKKKVNYCGYIYGMGSFSESYPYKLYSTLSHYNIKNRVARFCSATCHDSFLFYLVSGLCFSESSQDLLHCLLFLNNSITNTEKGL